jgi:hypothetical protein
MHTPSIPHKGTPTGADAVPRPGPERHIGPVDSLPDVAHEGHEALVARGLLVGGPAVGVEGRGVRPVGGVSVEDVRAAMSVEGGKGGRKGRAREPGEVGSASGREKASAPSIFSLNI